MASAQRSSMRVSSGCGGKRTAATLAISSATCLYWPGCSPQLSTNDDTLGSAQADSRTGFILPPRWVLIIVAFEVTHSRNSQAASLSFEFAFIDIDHTHAPAARLPSGPSGVGA